METVNPATGKKIKEYAEYAEPRVETILHKADKAFQTWRSMGFAERGACLVKAAGVLAANKQAYARLMADEMGKPLAQGEAEIDKCAWVCSFYAERAADYLKPDVIDTEAGKSFVSYEPLGIVLAVMPWNFPFWQIMRCAAPTLMAGNAMVLKHASNVCGCALAVENIFKEAGLPDGLFGTVLISNTRVAGLIGDPRIKAVTLTGSTQAGKSIASLAGGAIKKTVLELGGNDPYLVLADADVDAAVAVCALSRLINGGQSCIAAKRFIVHSSLLKEFTAKFITKMEAVRMGSPLDEGVTLGPMARQDLRDQMHADVQESVKRGAKILLGGVLPDGPGAFYPPTVLIDVHKGMPAYDREMFGPVAVIIKADSEEEAIHIANDSVYGLGAAVFSKDTARAEHIARTLIDAGCCFVNESVKSDPRLPFGGIKESGYGRELSRMGIHEFVNAKTVYVK